MDGGGIDIWRGTGAIQQAGAVICMVDTVKQDAEIKILLSCTEEEIETIYQFHNASESMKGLLIRRD